MHEVFPIGSLFSSETRARRITCSLQYRTKYPGQAVEGILATDLANKAASPNLIMIQRSIWTRAL